MLLFQFDFADEAFLPLLTVFGLMGLFVAFSRREWFLPTSLVAAMLLEPRSAPLFMCIPLAILAAQALMEIILPALEKSGSKRLAPIFLGLLLAYCVASALSVTATIRREITVQPAEREAMQWIQHNTPNNSIFLVMTGKLPLRDPVSEWFPALTGRVSAATIFGYEWIARPPFASKVDAYTNLQACRFQNADCLMAWGAENDVPFTHVMFTNANTAITPLEIYLKQTPNFAHVFWTPEVSIYELK